MSAFRAVNDVLVVLFRNILEAEEREIIADEFKDITLNDMHIIEAICIGTLKNMSTVAASLGITIGTLTTSINSLVRKGYVEKVKSESDRRVVFLALTKKGIDAYKHHEEYHIKMTEAVIKNLTEEEAEILVKSLKGINEYFELDR